jgi:hypothetical protein
MLSSRGVITEFFTVSASAPGYCVCTTTVGGAISGYCSIGSEKSPITPRITVRIDITVDSTGRLIKLVNVILSIIF